MFSYGPFIAKDEGPVPKNQRISQVKPDRVFPDPFRFDLLLYIDGILGDQRIASPKRDN
jgi:hypothetical protein